MAQQHDQSKNQLNQYVENKKDKGSLNTENRRPTLSIGGDAAEKEENLGGTTNLSLDQLKKEGDPQGSDTNE